MSEDHPVRCSDAEREQTTQALNEAAGEGRLSLTEVEERLTIVYAARYRHELAAVVADLPSPAPQQGWPPLFLLGQQLAGGLSARRRLAAAALALLALSMMMFMAAHGFVDVSHHLPHRFGP
ncbi:DUF1707 SHOCT-like domain-containing protein [Amycolatopsis benzoatilytica]|uniref:DUF1707 SHOCT-like domain-containing protein n=1 Tax=Amycolatopsis benzoatilytica TaxID=346045 RepID=UPI000381E88F|nr:DUF1707 domain-containing protein [Amycolatopsis benzoatilytica]